MLGQGVTEGAAQVFRAVGSTSHGVNDWLEHLNIGRYGTDFLLRAEVAETGWGANIPQEAVYINSTSDGHGDPYSGSRKYVLRFPAGSLPPAKAFWSLTVYGPDKFLVANAENRYSIGSHTPGLQTNPHGSLDLYLAGDAPHISHVQLVANPRGRVHANDANLLAASSCSARNEAPPSKSPQTVSLTDSVRTGEPS